MTLDHKTEGRVNKLLKRRGYRGVDFSRSYDEEVQQAELVELQTSRVPSSIIAVPLGVFSIYLPLAVAALSLKLIAGAILLCVLALVFGIGTAWALAATARADHVRQIAAVVLAKRHSLSRSNPPRSSWPHLRGRRN